MLQLHRWYQKLHSHVTKRYDADSRNWSFLMFGDFSMSDSLISLLMMFQKSFLTLVRHKKNDYIIIILLFFIRAAQFSGGAGQNFQSAEIYQQFADLPVDNAALFAASDWLPICGNVRGFTVCLLICSAFPSIQTLLLSFTAVCWLGWVFFFFFFLSWDLFCYFGTRWRGLRKRLLCPDASVKRGCPL